MQFNSHQSFFVPERSYLSITKRDIGKLVDAYDFNEGEKGKIDIIVSELASNLIKHTGCGGHLLIKFFGITEVEGIEIISIDNGPGMKDALKMMEDGISTSGTHGEGLGAIKRLSHEFDIYSLLDHGTVILSRFYKGDNKKKIMPLLPRLEIGVVAVPKTGEQLCGDAFGFKVQKDSLLIFAVDGLGHGPKAHEASQCAIEVFMECEECLPNDIIKKIHNSIKRTRGAVGAVSEISIKKNIVNYSGIGNISSRAIAHDESKNMVSYNGILGHNIPSQIHNNSFDLTGYHIFIMHSDGLKTRWDLSKYPDLSKRSPSVIAAMIYKENTRGTDDCLIIVVKIKP
jgi:anti-sigma regulatory factor (Ser/Thr protein kinase)